MAATNPAPKVYYDFLSSFEGGVNGGIEPLLLPKNQLARGENLSVRGAFATHRPPILNREFIWPSPVVQAQVEGGFFQGAGYYRPDFGTEQLIAQISGRLFSFTETGGKLTVADISVPSDLNDATVKQVWMWQAEKWMIVSDGTGALPIFYDGTTSRRSYGPSIILGSVTVAVPNTPPAIGGAIVATMSAIYNGPFNIPVLFNGEFYQVAGPAGGANARLTNINDTPLNVVPSGTQVIVNPNFVGYTIGLIGSTSSQVGALQCVTPTFCSTIYRLKFALNMESLGTATIGDSVTVTTNNGLETFIIENIVGSTMTIYRDIPSTIHPCPVCTLPPAPPAETIADGELVQFATSHGPSVVVGTTVANFTVPNVGAIVDVQLDVAYSGPANVIASIGGFQYLINSLAPVVGLNITLINLTDTTAAAYTLPANILSVPELPAGRMGSYGMGRVSMSLVDGASFIYGDIVGGASGTVANNFRDSVLKTTELTFRGGSFRLPGAGDIVTAMVFPVVLDASLGQGSLQIGTANSMFSSNVPFDSSLWATLQTPILTQSLAGKGPLGQNSTILANSDIIFREFDGLGTLIQARRGFTNSADTGGGNTPISHEMSYVFDLDDQSLLSYGSAITFDNRALETQGPSISSQGIVHDGLVSMNMDTVSNLRSKLPPVYEGAWIGLNVLQVVFGQINGVKRGFAFAVNTSTQKIEIHEFLSSQTTATMDKGSIPISWLFETPIAFNKDIKPINELIRLADGEIYTKDISGQVEIEVQYRPDFITEWTRWRLFTIDQSTWRPRMGLGEPSSNDCDETIERQMRVGYFFQFRVIITGHIKWMGMRLMASSEPQIPFARPICPTVVKPVFQNPDVSQGQSSDCVNLIPTGTLYNNTGGFPITLETGKTYKIIFGENENVFFSPGGIPNLLYAPGTYQFTVGAIALCGLQGIGPNLPITAVICKVTN